MASDPDHLIAKRITSDAVATAIEELVAEQAASTICLTALNLVSEPKSCPGADERASCVPATALVAPPAAPGPSFSTDIAAAHATVNGHAASEHTSAEASKGQNDGVVGRVSRTPPVPAKMLISRFESNKEAASADVLVKSLLTAMPGRSHSGTLIDKKDTTPRGTFDVSELASEQAARDRSPSRFESQGPEFLSIVDRFESFGDGSSKLEQP